MPTKYGGLLKRASFTKGGNLFNEKRNIIREQDASFSPFFFVLSIFICNFAPELYVLSVGLRPFCGNNINNSISSYSVYRET